MQVLITGVILLNVWGAGGEPAHNDVVVIEGNEADLPCVTSPPLEGSEVDDISRPQLIVWYKDGVRSSIYSYDGRNPENVRQWASRRSMGGALVLRLPSSPHSRPQLAFLNIGYIHQTDAGLYHCQVDFNRGPGRTTYTKLIVVAPPTAPSVEVWAGGRWLHTTHETSTATVEVGTKLTLRCSTSGGKPPPTVSWWRGGQQLLSSSTTEGNAVSSSVNVTVVPEDAHTPIVCQASNTHLMPPLRTPLLLLVLSPPKWLRVIGADMQMSAGNTYIVECRCVGARPPPVITWTVGGDELQYATSTTDAEGETTSRLRFTPKTAHFGTHITCTAHPTEHAVLAASPHSTPSLWVKSDSVPLKIQYKPEVQLKAQLMKKHYTNRHTKMNDKEDSLDVISKPPPFSPSTTIHRNRYFNSNKTTFMKESEDVGEDEDGDEEDKAIKVSKKSPKDSGAGRQKDGQGVLNVDEFGGVVLQCNVRANPSAYHVSWHKNGIPLSPVTTQGLLLGNMSAVFPNLKRTDAGNLTCTAHNKEGATRSNTVQLQINHGPECSRDSVKILGVPRHHTLNVTCDVESYPLPTSFSWALRSSRGILAVPPELVYFSDTMSWITYTPRANIDFGDLLCWAQSPTSRQEEPCVAQLVSAEKPDTPENCRITKREQNKLKVSCQAAHDGGLPQTFFLKVFHGGIEVANSTSVVPEITVYGLEPDTRYRLTMWSANTHGTSTGHTTLYTSTLPSNTSSTTSSMNGHSSKNPRGLLSKFGSSVLAVVVVITVVGVVVGIIVGIMVQKIDSRVYRRPRRHRDEEEEEDEGEEMPPTLVNNNQVNVAMAGIGRRVPKCLEPLGKSTARYDLMRDSEGKNDNHVYDDPITLREEIDHEAMVSMKENIEVTHNIRYPPSSMTSTNFSHKSPNFSWHLPNSRLLRNQFSQRYPPASGCPRKPVRVETPRLPEFDISTTITTRRKFQHPSGMEFRLILIPETSKMLQVALDRDARLSTYLSQDTHHPNSPMKFPTISEEDEIKQIDTHDDPSVTPYESTPDDFTIENGESDTSELLPKQDYMVETRATIHCEKDENMRNRISSHNYVPLHKHAASEHALDDIGITSQNIPTTTIYGNEQSKHCKEAQTRKPTPPRKDNAVVAFKNITNAKTLRIQKRSLPEVSPNPADKSSMRISLIGKQKEEANALLKRSSPSMALVGKLGRHHPYGTPLSNNIRRGIRSPSTHSGKKRMDESIMNSSTTSPNLIPSSPFSFLRQPKVGVTSLLSLVSTSSSTSSSSYASRKGKGSRETTVSPLSETRRRAFSGGARKSPFRNLRARPRSIHHITGPEQVLHWWGEEGEDCQSSSTPSSPRSSTSSSSCFPYSSVTSSPLSSFYSSQNSLSISATFSQESSSSSFCFSSSSSASSSPFSSFLSPSLTTPSSSSALSLLSCSPTPDSVLSGHITPT